MPTTRAAAKDLRQSRRRAAANRLVKEDLRYLIKRARTAAVGKDAKLSEYVAAAIRALDRAAQRGVIARGNADRRKSRISRLVVSVR